MRRKAFEKLIDSITYKPGFEISWTREGEGYKVHLLAINLQDSSGKIDLGPDDTLSVDFNFSCPDYCVEALSKNELKEQIFKFFVKCEEHECEEWFAFDGVKYQDAHANDGPKRGWGLQ